MAKRGNTQWNQFEANLRNKKQKNANAKAVPSDINVQRMSSIATGRLKKFHPVDTRDYVPFDTYDSITLKNIKEACERFYNSPRGSCDVLASDKGPSCTRDEQVQNKKVYFVRFLTDGDEDEYSSSRGLDMPAMSMTERTSITQTKQQKFISQPPKSISISTLLKAGKLITEESIQTISLKLEEFDVEESVWINNSHTYYMRLENKHFGEGGFRLAHKAFETKSDKTTTWVVKFYKQDSQETIENDLKLTLETHTRKQVQMHAVARHIAKSLQKKAPATFGECFTYNTVYFSTVDHRPITVEKYIDGRFTKYINNDGTVSRFLNSLDCIQLEQMQKAETLSHFSYEAWDRKLMLLDLQGTGYNLYDPEIATTTLVDDGEVFFCAGNLGSTAIDVFKIEHQCNKYCAMLKLSPINT